MNDTEKRTGHTDSNGLCLKKDISHCSQWYFEHINRWTVCECNEVMNNE